MIDVSVTEFVGRLEELRKDSPGDMAVLKRNAGATIAESHNAMVVFYRLLPYGIAGTPREETYFLVATLYGLNKYHHYGDFGSTMRQVKDKRGSDSVDNRFRILLDGEFEAAARSRGGGELSFRLRQLVALAASSEVGIDWPQLLNDLLFWNSEKRLTQKRWAQSYFGERKSEKAAAVGQEGGEQ
jgi:CRISPR type I-E-associated protein CasB/Cse2